MSDLGVETNDLPFCWEGMADVWLTPMGEGKRKKGIVLARSPITVLN